MKVIGIEGSPRSDGNTEKLVRAVLDGAANAGAESKLYKIKDMQIAPCTGCASCRETGECVIKDDMTGLLTSIQKSEGIVLGSPVYMGQVTGPMKIFMDRLLPLLRPDYTNRLEGKKKIAFAYTQGNPDASLFAPYFDYSENCFAFLGFELSGRVLATGTRAKDDIVGQTATLAAAGALGKTLGSAD